MKESHLTELWKDRGVWCFTNKGWSQIIGSLEFQVGSEWVIAKHKEFWNGGEDKCHIWRCASVPLAPIPRTCKPPFEAMGLPFLNSHLRSTFPILREHSWLLFQTRGPPHWGTKTRPFMKGERIVVLLTRLLRARHWWSCGDATVPVHLEAWQGQDLISNPRAEPDSPCHLGQVSFSLWH